MPVMDEIVRDFKVAESSSESVSVFRQAGSGLPDKPLKHLILLIHNVSLFAAQFSSTTRSSAPTEFVWDELSWRDFTRNITCVSVCLCVHHQTQNINFRQTQFFVFLAVIFFKLGCRMKQWLRLRLTVSSTIKQFFCFILSCLTFN